MIDAIRETLAVLGQHKVRTLLTGFGITWGVLLFIVFLASTNGLENGVRAQFGGTADTVYIWRANVTQLAYKGLNTGRWVDLDDSDVSAIETSGSNIRVAIGINEVGNWGEEQVVKWNNNTAKFIVQGSHPEVSQMNGFLPTRGRFINALDVEHKRKVVVLGQRAKEILFGAAEALHEYLLIEGVNFKVVGVFSPEASGTQAAQDSRLVLIPNATLRNVFNQRESIYLLRIAPTRGVSSSIIENEALAALREHRKIHPEDLGVYGSYNTQKHFASYERLFAGIRTFGWLVSIGTLLAAIIGVRNIMTIIVKERTVEIGIRKALGATNMQVVTMVLRELFFLVGISAAVGAGIASAITVYARQITSENPHVFGDVFVDPHVSTQIIVAYLAILMILCAVSSITPLLNAIRIDPIRALNDI